MKHRAVGGETAVESDGKRGSRWVSHLVDGGKAREMKRGREGVLEGAGRM